MKTVRLGRGLVLTHILVDDGEVHLELVPSLFIDGSSFPIAAGIGKKTGTKN